MSSCLLANQRRSIENSRGFADPPRRGTRVAPRPSEPHLEIPSRQKTIDRLPNDPFWEGHWVGYWQDVLAENPGILKPDPNNTGPFRWWLHQSFAENISFDRLVAELIAVCFA
jgi:hypothetical protein